MNLSNWEGRSRELLWVGGRERKKTGRADEARPDRMFASSFVSWVLLRTPCAHRQEFRSDNLSRTRLDTSSQSLSTPRLVTLESNRVFNEEMASRFSRWLVALNY